MALRPWPAFKSFSPKLWCENAFSRHIYARKRDAFLYSAVLTMIIFVYPQKEWRSFLSFSCIFRRSFLGDDQGPVDYYQEEILHAAGE
jgi:hypothetical protein